MIVDTDAGGREAFAEVFDVCVVGSGPAGITLARKLKEQGLHVALMEAGGRDPSPESQELYGGENVGLPYFPLDVTRLRFLGGSSNHWQGWCRRLAEHDFKPRPGDPWSGWPIARTDLVPYEAEADAILEMPSADGFDYFEVEQAEPIFVGFNMRRSDPPVRFGEKYADEIEASNAIRLGLNANLVDLRIDEETGAVTEALFRGYGAGDPGFAVRARAYALCLGGLENPRALLNANSQRPAGLGNEHDLVGRFFSEHPHYDIGEILLERPLEMNYQLTPTLETMREREILNFTLTLLRVRAYRLTVLNSAVRSVPCATGFTERLAERVLNRSLYCDTRDLAAYRAQQAAGFPDAVLGIRSEQALNPDSRVRLASSRDALGLRQIELDWRLSEIDFRTMREAALAFGAHIAERGAGRLRVVDWLLDETPQVPPWPEADTGGHHHMCATRMAANPRRGVVDANCRVHSVPNLYLGGSSVFATGGWANPTYTIVQLALRLGDHLANELAEHS